MIKNIIFDFGNVVIRWDTDALLKKYSLDDTALKCLKEVIFESEEWLQMDSGLLNAKQAETIFQSKVPYPLKDQVSEIMCTWFEKVEFHKDTCDLIRKWKEQGYKIYCLSNTNIQFYEYIKKSDIGIYFDGFVISAAEKLINPDFSLAYPHYGKNPPPCGEGLYFQPEIHLFNKLFF